LFSISPEHYSRPRRKQQEEKRENNGYAKFGGEGGGANEVYYGQYANSEFLTQVITSANQNLEQMHVVMTKKEEMHVNKLFLLLIGREEARDSSTTHIARY